MSTSVEPVNEGRHLAEDKLPQATWFLHASTVALWIAFGGAVCGVAMAAIYELSLDAGWATVVMSPFLLVGATIGLLFGFLVALPLCAILALVSRSKWVGPVAGFLSGAGSTALFADSVFAPGVLIAGALGSYFGLIGERRLAIIMRKLNAVKR